MKTSTHLRKARALVNKGWCKGRAKMINNKGMQCYCSVGALAEVNDDNYSDAWEYLNKQIKNYDPSKDMPKNHGVVVFNDHPKTTKKDVLAVFDLAIKKAVEDEAQVR